MPVEHLTPYVNFHELNLDWILSEIMKLRSDLNEALLDNFTITYAQPLQWSILTHYDKYVLVMDSNDVAYLSMQDVPAGTPLTNTNYWIEVGDFYQLLNLALTNFAPNQVNNAIAMSNYTAGSLVVLNYWLYRCTTNISAGTVLQDGVNITRITLNGMKQNYDSQLANLNSTVGQHTIDIGTLQNDVNALPEMSDVYFAPSEVFNLDNGSAYYGWTANSGLSIFMIIPMPKHLANINSAAVTSTSFKCAIRVGEGGYINNSQYLDISGYINSITVLKNSNQLKIEILNTVSWTYGSSAINVTVNAPVSIMVNGTAQLTFA